MIHWKNTDKTIAVAVSGGEDSMCLLHFLHAQGQKIVAVTVNHQIRKNGKTDADFVENFCEVQEIPFLRFDADVPAFAKQNKMGTEEAARACRYAIFRSVLNEKKADMVALAHHQDDQAETVLLNILRGCGLKGLVGMQNSESFIRPFLTVQKKDIRAYLAAHNVPHIEDETNADTGFSRNYIRHEILPRLKEKFPAFPSSLQTLSQSAAEAEEYFSGEARKYIQLEKHAAIIPISAFSLPAPLPSYLLLQSLSLLDARKDIERKHIAEILKKIPVSRGGVFYELPNRTTVGRKKSAIIIEVRKAK